MGSVLLSTTHSHVALRAFVPTEPDLPVVALAKHSNPFDIGQADREHRKAGGGTPPKPRCRAELIRQRHVSRALRLSFVDVERWGPPAVDRARYVIFTVPFRE